MFILEHGEENGLKDMVSIISINKIFNIEDSLRKVSNMDQEYY